MSSKRQLVNSSHVWRIRSMAPKICPCQLCGNAKAACVAFDWDLSGPICNQCFGPVRSAEDALAGAGISVNPKPLL